MLPLISSYYHKVRIQKAKYISHNNLENKYFRGTVLKAEIQKQLSRRQNLTPRPKCHDIFTNILI